MTAAPVFAEIEEFSFETGETELTEALPEIEEIPELPAVNGVIVKTKSAADISDVTQSLSLQSTPLRSFGAGLFSMDGETGETSTGEPGTLSLLSVGESDIQDVLDELSQNENVEYAQPNYRVALSEININQWGLQNAGQSANTFQGTEGYDINVIDAWNITQGSADVLVGVIDSGIDITHEALAEKIWANPNETADETDDDGNGYIDDINGWDFVNGDGSVYDGAAVDEHGTHIAGIIASVAPNVKIMPLKAFTYNAGYTFDIVNAIEYAEAMGVKIVNCSFAGTEYNTALADAMEQSNMLFVCAAGNYARSTDELAPFPACYGFPNILSVAAIDSAGALSPISTYGDKIDIAAPGINIYSALPENQYGFKDGTSMAAAYASGAASLVLSNNGELTAAQIRQTIMESAATPAIMPEGVDETENLLDVNAALEYEFPEVEITEKETQTTPILDENPADKLDETQYPFNFELESGVLSLIIEHETPYDSVFVLGYEKGAEKDAEPLIDGEFDSEAAYIELQGFVPGVEYEIDIKFNSGGIIESYAVDMNTFSDGETNTDTVNFNVSYHHTYADENAETSGDFELAGLGPIYEAEPNNTYTAADTTYDDYDVKGYLSSSSDADYFKVTFSSNGVANFWLDVPDNSDFELVLYDRDGTTLLDYSRNGTGKDELIRHYPVVAGRTYYIKIYWFSGTYGSGAYYLLRAKWVITPDIYDERGIDNDTFSKAATIPSNSSISANINFGGDSGSDVDFFKFTITSAQYVNIVLWNMPNDYDMKIYDGPGENYHIATSQKAKDEWGTPAHDVYSANLPAKTYYVKIYSYNNAYAAENYKLTVATGRNALGLENEYFNRSLNSTGNTFYSFSLTSARLLYIELSFASGNDLDFYIYKKGGASSDVYDEVKRAYTASNPETLALSLTSGNYLLWINRYGGSSLAYDILTYSSTNVTDTASQITLSGFPNTMEAGKSRQVSVTFKNMGLTEWTRSDKFDLYTTNISSTGQFMTLPVQLGVNDRIKFGQSKTFQITLTAPKPTAKTTYAVSFVMRQNFGNIGASSSWNIEVTPELETLVVGVGKTVSGLSEKSYSMEIPTSGNYVFRTLRTSADSDTVLTLYSASSPNTPLVSNDSAYDGAASSKFSKIERMNMAAGN
jgi:subtilisin family serine protease